MTPSQEVTAIDEDCAGIPTIDAEPGTEIFTDIFRWDAASATYVAATNNRAGLVKGR